MAQISFSIGEDLNISGPFNNDNCVSVSSTKYIGEGEQRDVYSRDTVCFHADSAGRLREFAEQLLASVPKPKPAEPVEAEERQDRERAERVPA